MRFKKLVAAISAAAMLGTLAAAVPASAATQSQTVTGTSTWSSSNDKQNGYANKTTDGGVTITAATTAPNSADFNGTTFDTNKDVCFGVNWVLGSKSESTVEKDVKYTLHYTIEGSWSKVDNASSPYGVYINASTWNSDGERVDNKTNNNIVDTNPNTATEKTYEITPSTDGYLQVQFTLRRVSAGDYVTVSNVYVTKEVEIADTSVNIVPSAGTSSDSRLYKGDEVSFTTSPSVTSPTYTFTASDNSDNSDITSQFTKNEDGSYTYNNAGRTGDGMVTVAISNDGYTGSATIYVQRQGKLVSKVIKDSSISDGVTMTVAASVTDGNTDAQSSTTNVTPDTTTTNVNVSNGYSHATAISATFSVPSGYYLDVTETSDISVTNDQTSTVTVTYSGTTPKEGDLAINGTIKRLSDSDYRTADGTISAAGDVTGVSEGDQYWTFTTTDADKTAVMFKNSAGSETSVKVNFDTQVTTGDVVFSIIVSGSANVTGLQAKLSTVE